MRVRQRFPPQLLSKASLSKSSARQTAADVAIHKSAVVECFCLVSLVHPATLLSSAECQKPSGMQCSRANCDVEFGYPMAFVFSTISDQVRLLALGRSAAKRSLPGPLQDESAGNPLATGVLQFPTCSDWSGRTPSRHQQKPRQKNPWAKTGSASLPKVTE